MRGRTGACPYLAGQNKWDGNYDGIDLMTGNFTQSATDISFDGGYGIPVNVTRSYSSNNGGDGPFGIGWALSADVRSTAGGILKSKAAPVRTVPVSFKEMNPADHDPNVATQPAAAVQPVDAAGRTETVQKDVDGVLTTPAWDNNVSNPTWQWVQQSGSWYQIQTGNQTTTLDGTVYTYQSEGSYLNGGTIPWNQPTATPTPSNVLKVTQVQDRQGNVTYYNYNQSVWVTYSKPDGTTQEHPISSVVMPNGHTLTFAYWTGSDAGHVKTISDGTRTVQYAYTNGLLTSVTTPASRTTQYGYGAANGDGTGNIAYNLLTSVTDPRGLTTRMAYQMGLQNLDPYEVDLEAPICVRVIKPNGVEFYFEGPNIAPPDGDWPSSVFVLPNYPSPSQFWYETGGPVNSGGVWMQTGGYTPNNLNGQFSIGWSRSWPTPAKGLPDWSAYDPNSQNLLEDTKIVQPNNTWGTLADLASVRDLSNTDAWRMTDEQTAYNFAGNPLSKTDTEEYSFNTHSWTITRTATTSYAYWDGTKYFQQKAVKDPGGRYSYTDYYPSTAAAGSRGQQYQVYDNAHAGFYLNTNITPPSYAQPQDYWKYQLTPTAGQYTAQFAYDSVGRCTDVWKLQSTTSNPWTYVHTVTSYGSNTDGSWGQANKVVEDSGGINRTTQTLGYTAWGKADDVIDAAGHEFKTAFDLDGNVQTVTRVDSGLNQSIASYSYGTSGISNGQVTAVTDGLTGVTDSIAYQPTGGGTGQVSSVAESGGPNANYSVTYAYNVTGDRWQTTYSTPNSANTWEYDNYEPAGYTANLKRVFQTLTLLQSGVPGKEQIQYAYDNSGALKACAFAQTPAAGFTPASGQPWYDSSHLASSRARAYYLYDPAGRVQTLEHDWDVWNGSGYTTSGISQNICAYELTGLNRGVKTTSTFNHWGGSSWVQDRQESYSYDPNLDYLTGANYGDGLPNQNPTWAYDAAANRTDSVVDNLNRTTSIGGISTNCDILGNRLTLGSNVSYGWDALNRMASCSNSGAAENYTYRADGMRVLKASSSASTLYRYDGQMGFEDLDASGSSTTLTDYGLGARGIDWISSAVNGGQPTIGFPLYDAHGNMTACLFRSGTSSYTTGNQRTYDAWGVIRSGAGSGDPKGRYCGNLGHKQDDESGLIYMRARYCEPGSGRFISEDPGRHGGNLFIYASDDPVNLVDSDGKDAASWLLFLGAVLLEVATYFVADPAALHIAAAGLLAAGLTKEIARTFAEKLAEQIIDAQTRQIITLLNQVDNSLAGQAAENSLAGSAVDACNEEDGEVEGEFIAEDIDQWEDDGGGMG